VAGHDATGVITGPRRLAPAITAWFLDFLWHRTGRHLLLPPCGVSRRPSPRR
jgi:hypothetical protein